MKEKTIICPSCGAVITLDDATYAEIINQVKAAEVDREVARRMDELKRLHEAEEAARITEESARHREELSGKDKEIERLQQQIDAWEEKKALEMKTVELQAKEDASKEIRAKEDELRKKGEEINRLIAEASNEKTLAAERMKNLLEAHKQEVENLQKEVELYKGFKARRSVKLLGEDLEQHCLTQYNTYLAPVLSGATFQKDNLAVKEDGEEKGTKGDFIFRAKEDDVEYLSIMFEMKNEGDASTHRHRNEDFFEKLDKDRRKKGCEFAVLVSMLELDNEMYNGVYSVPGYEKMYVVRPDNFIPIITLLVQTSKKSAAARKEIAEMKERNIDVTNFEATMEAFKKGFTDTVTNARNRYEEAVKGINNAIDTLTAIKENLRLWAKHMGTANNKLEDLTIRKLTYANPTMKEAFAEARAKAEEKKAQEGPDEQ